MSELMDRLLAGKLRTRKELAALPFDQKLEIMERIRERNALLAENPLRTRNQATNPSVVPVGPQETPPNTRSKKS